MNTCVCLRIYKWVQQILQSGKWEERVLPKREQMHRDEGRNTLEDPSISTGFQIVAIAFAELLKPN